MRYTAKLLLLAHGHRVPYANAFYDAWLTRCLHVILSRSLEAGPVLEMVPDEESGSWVVAEVLLPACPRWHVPGRLANLVTVQDGVLRCVLWPVLLVSGHACFGRGHHAATLFC